MSLFIAIALQIDAVPQYFFNESWAQEIVTEESVVASTSSGQIAGVEEYITEPKRVYDTKSIGVVLSTPTSFVIDDYTDYVLWEQSADEIVSIASITKLASVATLLEQDLDMNSIITISSKDLRPQGGNRHIYLGEQVRVIDLLHAVLISSDNEALMALVHSTGMSEEEFVQNINDWASNNDLVTLSIVEPTGLDGGNIASARDVADLAKLVFENDLVTSISEKSKYTFQTINTKRNIKLDNTNRLLGSVFSVEVGKTGFIDEAGYCLVTKSNITDDRDVITVVLGADSITSRFQDTKALLYWVGENYRW